MTIGVMNLALGAASTSNANRCHRRLRQTVSAKRTRAAGMSPAARELRSDVVRRAASRGETSRCAETHALPTVMSISPTPLIDQIDMAGGEATSRQRCCGSRHLFRLRRKTRDCWNGVRIAAANGASEGQRLSRYELPLRKQTLLRASGTSALCHSSRALIERYKT